MRGAGMRTNPGGVCPQRVVHELSGFSLQEAGMEAPPSTSMPQEKGCPWRPQPRRKAG